MKEVWKDIYLKDFVGFYMVSNKGRVKSLDRVIVGKNGFTKYCYGIVLRLKTNGKGYKRVCLRKPGISKSFFVHSLVFIYICMRKTHPKTPS